jgi:hypothetical protein
VLASELIVALAVAASLVSVASAADSPTPPRGRSCLDARHLIDLGEPQSAITLIKGLRAANPSPSPSSAPTAAEPQGATSSSESAKPFECSEEYKDAVAHQARAVGFLQWADQLTAAVGDKNDTARVTFDNAPPFPCTTGAKVAFTSKDTAKQAKSAVKAAEREALSCDRENKDAIARNKEPDQKSLAQASKKDWTAFSKDQLAPWVPMLLAFLGWCVIVLVVGRLLLLVMGNTTARFSTHRNVRPILLAVAWVLLALSGGFAVGLVTLLANTADGFTWWAAVIFGPPLLVAGVVITWLSVRPPRSASPTMPEKWSKKRYGAMACGLLLGIVGLLVVLFLIPLKEPLTQHPRVGLLLGIAAALVFAVAWGGGRRLTITSKGDGPPTSESLRATLRLLAPNVPKGVEVPLGTDADVLSAVGIVATSSTPLVAALARVLTYATPPTPWQLTVTAHSADVLTADLMRNRKLIDTATIKRSTLEALLGDAAQATDADDDKVSGSNGDTSPGHGGAAAKVDLSVFPAAMTVIGVATADGSSPPGLGNTTKWRSLAYQYLASTQPRGGHTAQAFAAQAVTEDPKSDLARVAYWYALYRDADEHGEMDRYVKFLKRLTPVGGQLKNDEALRIRVLYMRVAIGINLLFAPDDSESGLQQPDESLLKDAAELLKVAPENTDYASLDRDFLREVHDNAKALTLSIPQKGPLTHELPEKPEEPEAHSPDVNYSLACYFATKDDWPTPTRTSTPSPANSAEDRKVAIEHLQLASVMDYLDTWMRQDPQLEKLRESAEYRKAFGSDLPTDPFDLSPFKEQKRRLVGSGLVTIDKMASTTVEALHACGMKTPMGTWVRQCAVLGASIRQVLRGEGEGDTAVPADAPDWYLAVLKPFVEAGRTAVPATDDVAGARADLKKALKVYKGSPEDVTWIIDKVAPEPDST